MVSVSNMYSINNICKTQSMSTLYQGNILNSQIQIQNSNLGGNARHSTHAHLDTKHVFNRFKVIQMFIWPRYICSSDTAL